METAAAVMLGLFTFLSVSAWASSRREQREMELRYELYARLLDRPGAEADALWAQLDKDDHLRQAAAAAQRREGGLTVLAVGIGLGVFIYFIAPRSGIYMLAFLPITVGLIILMGARRTPSRKNGRPTSA